MKLRPLVLHLIPLVGAAFSSFGAASTGSPFYGDAPDATHPRAVHDRNRPQPKRVEPGTFSTPSRPGKPPSDAIVLFDGTAAALGPPPLTVHVRADGYFACRDVATGVTIPLAGDAWDEAGLQAYLAQDRETFPGADQIVINTDDGVPYEAMIGVLDQSRAAGFPNAMLAGGAPNPG